MAIQGSTLRCRLSWRASWAFPHNFAGATCCACSKRFRVRRAPHFYAWIWRKWISIPAPHYVFCPGPGPRWPARRHKMTNLARFFNGSETTFGVFYPRHYLVAVFENPKAASSAVRKLYIAGFSQSAAIAVDGRAVLELEKEETGLAAFVMEALSRFFATEQVFTEHDLCHARHGAGFVAVHCTTDE